MIFKISLLFLSINHLLQSHQAVDLFEVFGVKSDCGFDCQGELEEAEARAKMATADPPLSPKTNILTGAFRLAHGVLAPVVDAIIPLNQPVAFQLFNRSHEEPEVVTFPDNNRSPIYKTYNPNRKTKILIHGWTSSAEDMFPTYVKKAYTYMGDYNLILVDWSSTSYWIYPTAALRIPVVAETVAKFIDRLYTDFNLQPKDIHIIGHSLGAHIAGVAGLLVTYGKIGRITGLDPANPLIDPKDTRRALSVYSATFVDVIHTSAGLLGVKEPIGHVDFYPNGGEKQPGCGSLIIGHCSHRRAYAYYAESIIVSEGYPSTRCTHWEVYKLGGCLQEPQIAMGEYVPRSARGQYYLFTNFEMPFATPGYMKNLAEKLRYVFLNVTQRGHP